MRHGLVVAAGMLAGLAGLARAQGLWDALPDGHGAPWSVAANCPVVTAAAPARETSRGIGGTVALGGLWIYQHVLHVVVRSQCPMLPSCSRFSAQAIRKHGAWGGLLLTVDRLLHEGSEFHAVPKIRRGERYLGFDPVSNNDFWWE